MKNQFFAKLLLLPFLLLFTLSVAVKAQVEKNDPISHIRTVGGDNRFDGQTFCPQNPLDQVDVLNVSLHVAGQGSTFSWPRFCSEYPRIAVFYRGVPGAILLGYSEPITSFQYGETNEGAEACSPDIARGATAPHCSNIFHANVSVPVDFSSICGKVSSCEAITLEYRLVGTDITELESPYALQVSNECIETLFPESCFCHAAIDDEGALISQDVWLNCSIANARTSSQEEFEVSNFSIATPETIPTAKVSQIQVYPNPVHDQLVIQYHNPEEKSTIIQVLDNHGRKVVKPSSIVQTGSSTWQIQTQNLLPGIYFCQIQIGKELITKKIVKLSK